MAFNKKWDRSTDDTFAGANYSAAGSMANADQVLWDAVTASITGGAAAVTLDLGAVTKRAGITSGGTVLTLGSSGTYCDVDATLFKYEGRFSSAYLMGDITQFHAAHESGTLYLDDGGAAITRLWINTLGGHTVIKDGATVTNVIFSPRVPHSQLTIGAGAVNTLFAMTNGIAASAGTTNLTTVEVRGGTFTHTTAGTVTTLKCIGGRTVYKSTGTVTTCIVYPGAELDLIEGPDADKRGAVTFTTLYVMAGGIVRTGDTERLTVTNGFFDKQAIFDGATPTGTVFSGVG